MAQLSVLHDFFARSRAFYSKHPRPISSATTLESLFISGHISEYNAKKYIQTNRILVHQDVRSIIKSFLEYKRVTGTRIEKAVYSHFDWNVEQFIIRLVTKRPLSFLNSTDTTLLRDGRQFSDATANWDHVGTDHEYKSVPMVDYLTYEEMMISSLIGVSGYTAYLNDGRRSNEGILELDKAHKEGIQIGLVGARFERKGRMDSVYVSDQADSHSFLRSFFPGQTFEQRYKSRIRIPIETMLIEAQDRGQGSSVGRKVWLNVVGLGLGAWRFTPEQDRWYIEVFTEALNHLNLSLIDTIEFGWLGFDKYTKINQHTRKAVETAAAKSSTKIIWSQRAPSGRLPDSSLLLITTYAWDSNSYPGNEFYMNQLSASGDPAAAASSLISETQNPEINTSMLDSIVYLS